jgi:alpha-glucosidase (family GH31 glycosyl hydrolase)
MTIGATVLDDLPGALAGKECNSQDKSSLVFGENSITNGALTAAWAADGLKFKKDDGTVLLSTAGSLSTAMSMKPAVTPGPGPGPGPAPQFACQDDCSLGITGIEEHTDAADCEGSGKILNISRAECCAACKNQTVCQAWAWGRDSADAGHRHNCYLCKGLKGTISRLDRDFGCVERLGVLTQNSNVTSYFATGAAFSSSEDEAFAGLGQHSKVEPSKCSAGPKCGQWKLNQKGFTWPLGISKFQIMVPFLTSSKRYGFFYNHPGDGTVAVGNASLPVVWNSTMQRQIDIWITTAPADDQQPFATILRQYADATGHAPLLPHYATGFWQSKMRYRTSDELVDIAQEYKQREVPLSVIVIDFYSWTQFGDFQFDKICWPNMSQATALIGAQGTRVLRSTYPWVDESSVNYKEAHAKGYLAMTDKGEVAKVAPGGDALIDPFNPAAREFVWSKCKASFFEEGIEMFWLDDTEPNVKQTGLVYACGATAYCGAQWPNKWIEVFVEGVRNATKAKQRMGRGAEEKDWPVMLSRAGWAGVQTTGAVIWSSDIPSTFESLQVQVRAGLNMMMSGVPWWTTDIGGFFGGDTSSDYFRELIVRWYQYGAFCPSELLCIGYTSD